ncbi:MAG: Uma2 family endonuclease, partial [Dolichospermum sp.]
MIVTAIRPVTIEEFLQLPETEPASEFINGQIIQK